MFDHVFQRTVGYATGGLSLGSFRPPSNQVFSAAFGLAICACIAMQMVIDAPRSGNLGGALIAAKDVVAAAMLFTLRLKSS
jgi:hypothetical protein